MEDAIRRLELVADRLERHTQATPASTPAQQQSQPSPQSSAAPRSAPAPAAAPSAAVTGDAAAAFKALVTQEATKLQQAAAALPPEVQAATACMVKGFEELHSVVASMPSRPTPTPQDLQAVVGQVASQIQAADALASARRSASSNHCKAILEGLQALAWIAYTSAACGMSTPPVHASETSGTADVYLNKVLMEFRATAPEHKDWVLAVKALLAAHQRAVQAHFPGGPVWGGAAGGSVTAPAPAAAAPASANAEAKASQKTGPPPPPPPPRAGQFFEKPAGARAAAPAPANFLAELSKGSAVTSGLRKVTDDMKTKNQANRTGAVPAGSTASKAAIKPAAAAAAAKRPPSKELVNRRWVIEYFDGDESLVLEAGEVAKEHSVYVTQCKNCVLQIKGKVNNIMLDNCSKVGLVFDSLLSSCEVVNCKSMQVQCTGACPTLAVDKTDGVQVFMNRETLANTEITTAKSSSVNICIAPDSPDDDPVEHPVPEQFMSRFLDGKLVTTPVVHSAG